MQDPKDPKAKADSSGNFRSLKTISNLSSQPQNSASSFSSWFYLYHCSMFRVEVSSEDVTLEGGADGSKVSISLTAQGNTLDSANGC